MTMLICGITFAPTAEAQRAPAVGTFDSAASPGSLTEVEAVRLPQMEVTGVAGPAPGVLPQPYAGGQVARGGSLGLLGTRGVMDTPFSTTNYTSQLIENQQARTAADTLINDSSVRLTTGSNGFDDTFQIRGFPVPSQSLSGIIC